jgi:hypothetical protein
VVTSAAAHGMLTSHVETTSGDETEAEDEDIARAQVKLPTPFLPDIEELPQVPRTLGLPKVSEVQEHMTAHMLKYQVDHATLFELHANLRTLGMRLCHASQPRCDICPLSEHCNYGRRTLHGVGGGGGDVGLLPRTGQGQGQGQGSAPQNHGTAARSADQQGPSFPGSRRTPIRDEEDGSHGLWNLILPTESSASTGTDTDASVAGAANDAWIQLSEAELRERQQQQQQLSPQRQIVISDATTDSSQKATTLVCAVSSLREYKGMRLTRAPDSTSSNSSNSCTSSISPTCTVFAAVNTLCRARGSSDYCQLECWEVVPTLAFSREEMLSYDREHYAPGSSPAGSQPLRVLPQQRVALMARYYPGCQHRPIVSTDSSTKETTPPPTTEVGTVVHHDKISKIQHLATHGCTQAERTQASRNVLRLQRRRAARHKLWELERHAQQDRAMPVAPNLAPNSHLQPGSSSSSSSSSAGGRGLEVLGRACERRTAVEGLLAGVCSRPAVVMAAAAAAGAGAGEGGGVRGSLAPRKLLFQERLPPPGAPGPAPAAAARVPAAAAADTEASPPPPAVPDAVKASVRDIVHEIVRRAHAPRLYIFTAFWESAAAAAGAEGAAQRAPPHACAYAYARALRVWHSSDLYAAPGFDNDSATASVVSFS